MIQSRLPFTDEGRIEVLSERFSQVRPIEAWREVLQDLPYITAEQRAVALECKQWLVEPAAHQAAFHIDRDLRVVAIQGGWWYRGITAVEPHGEGSKITYVVVNELACSFTRISLALGSPGSSTSTIRKFERPPGEWS
jgi:hypothetical protein